MRRSNVFLCSAGLLSALTAGQAQAPPAALSTHIYEHVFRHVVLLKQKSDNAAAKGHKSNYRSYYKDQAKLTQGQVDALESVALACIADLSKQDDKAFTVIRAARASAPNRKLLPGEKPPSPPPELAAMQRERDKILANARDGLSQALGNAFPGFEAYLKDRFRTGQSKATAFDAATK